MPSKTSASEILEIPQYYYFSSGNDYSGSLEDFAYKVKNGDMMKALTWHGRLCSDKAEIENEAEFERSEEGFKAMVKWLSEKAQEK